MMEESIKTQIDFIREKCKGIKPLVAIKCITYNHELYLKEALEGFVTQKTDFPFVAIVHDDASTDKTAEILREYAQKYPDIIFPIFEKENQYSKNMGVLRDTMNSAIECSGAKYIALCEGDDYWVDPLKLQKQVDFLESHTDYSMCATNNYIRKSNNIELKEDKYNIKRTRDTNIKEIILRGGAFIATSTILFRSRYDKDKPYEKANLSIGDYPLQIYLTHKGKVKLFKDITSVYRLGGLSSWTNRVNKESLNYKKKKDAVEYGKFMMSVMNDSTENKYTDIMKDWCTLDEFNSLAYFFPSHQLKIFLKNPILILKYVKIKKIIFSFLPIKLKAIIIKKEIITD